MRTLSTVTGFALLGTSAAFLPNAPRMEMKAEPSFVDKIKAGVTKAVIPAIASGAFLVAPPAQAITNEKLQELTYLQVKGTGLANRCPEVVGEGSINLGGGKTYQLVDLCIEPKTFAVEEEFQTRRGDVKKEFVPTKLVTRQTYTLAGISGDLKVGGDGKVVFEEKDGIDYAPTTVQMPAGERVPFLFTVKELVATASTGGSTIKPGFQFGGSFTVPSYRTGVFLDPKGRGTTTGYDQAVALPGLQNGVEGDAELLNENDKRFVVSKGNIELEVNKVNTEAGEIGGVFVSEQESDTDLGAKAPKKVLLKGVFYGRIES